MGRVCLSFIPTSPEVRFCCWSWSGGGGGIAVVFRVVCGSHGSIDVEAFPHGVITIRLSVGVSFYSDVETFAPFFPQLLS